MIYVYYVHIIILSYNTTSQNIISYRMGFHSSPLSSLAFFSLSKGHRRELSCATSWQIKVKVEFHVILVVVTGILGCGGRSKISKSLCSVPIFIVLNRYGM